MPKECNAHVWVKVTKKFTSTDVRNNRKWQEWKVKCKNCAATDDWSGWVDFPKGEDTNYNI